MEIVLDASAILAVLLNEPERDKIVTATQGSALVSPGCLPWEVANALSAMVKRGRTAAALVCEVFSRFEAIPVRLVSVDFGNVLRLSANHGLYAYDACYLDCAHGLRAPLVTLDRRLRAAAGHTGITALEVRP